MKKLKAAEGKAVIDSRTFLQKIKQPGGFLELIFGKGSKGINNVTSENSLWSPEKMAGLREYAPGSYGSGKQTGQQTAKASKGKFIIGKGSDYIKDLL